MKSPITARSPHARTVAPMARPGIQPKLMINSPGDRYEQEADAMAGQVMHMHGQQTPLSTGVIGPSVQRKCAACEEEEKKKPVMRKAIGNVGGGMQASPAMTSSLAASRGGGAALPGETKSFMESAFSADFSKVRVHTDSQASAMSKGIQAKAFTVGQDIYFNSGQYNPQSTSGKHLLAHELTHTLQQGDGRDMAQCMIQRTTVGQVLDEFFSPWSSETLWEMDSSDDYTTIVRAWQPVIDAVSAIKQNIASDCATWESSHWTDSSWQPGMTDPPATDPNAVNEFVPSPPGTDPDTCRNAFILYQGSRAVGILGGGLSQPIQTWELYTCSIGSFNIYVTVDMIDCATNTATLNIWMYNAMSQRSFGRFASHPAFRLSGMEKQYMWWNWTETISWTGAGTVTTVVPPDSSDW